jgi:hypothetical protein
MTWTSRDFAGLILTIVPAFQVHALRLVVVFFVLQFSLSSVAIGQQSSPKDIAVLVLEHQDKDRGLHYLRLPAETCDQLRKRLKTEGPFTLTLPPADKPGAPNRGLVLEAFCVKPDGSILGPDGPVSVDALNKRK